MAFENADPTDVTAAVTASIAVAVSDLWQDPAGAVISGVLLGSCSAQRRRDGSGCMILGRVPGACPGGTAGCMARAIKALGRCGLLKLVA